MTALHEAAPPRWLRHSARDWTSGGWGLVLLAAVAMVLVITIESSRIEWRWSAPLLALPLSPVAVLAGAYLHRALDVERRMRVLDAELAHRASPHEGPDPAPGAGDTRANRRWASGWILVVGGLLTFFVSLYLLVEDPAFPLVFAPLGLIPGVYLLLLGRLKRTLEDRAAEIERLWPEWRARESARASAWGEEAHARSKAREEEWLGWVILVMCALLLPFEIPRLLAEPQGALLQLYVLLPMAALVTGVRLFRSLDSERRAGSPPAEEAPREGLRRTAAWILSVAGLLALLCVLYLAKNEPDFRFPWPLLWMMYGASHVLSGRRERKLEEREAELARLET